jgi:predicted permease
LIRDGVRRLFTLSFRRRDWEREVEDEIRLHLELRAAALAEQGLTPESATAEAMRRFGPLTESRAQLVAAARHREQRMQRVELWSTLKQDLTFAFRSFGRYKLWTGVAIVTLGLGIGATTAVFSATSSLLLHPLPYPNADRVVIVQQRPSEKNNTGVQVTITPQRRLVTAWKANSRSFEDLQAYEEGDALLRTSGEPVSLHVAEIQPGFLRFAGIRPLIGRTFTDAEAADHAPLVLLGESAWRSRFGADRGVLGKAITLDDTLYTIIGVAPSDLKLPNVGGDPIAAWLPLDITAPNRGASVVGRLAGGTSIPTATHDLDAISARVNASTRGTPLAFRTVLMSPTQLVGFRQSLVILTWAVALVLLVACTNVAHLLLARTATRKRELAIRGALGAGGARLFRQLLTEAMVLTLAGALLGVLLAWLGVHAVVRFHPASLGELSSVHVDLTTLALTAAVAVASALAFGVLGAAHERNTHEALKAGALSTSQSRGQDRLRSVLVISEMALSAVLLVGASLLVRSAVRLQKADLGFTPAGLYAIDPGLHEPTPTEANRDAMVAARRALSAELAARLSRALGVKGITFAAVPPGSRSFMIGALEVEGEAAPDANTTSLVDNNAIQPDFFRVMGIRLLRGSTFTDTSATSAQVIVNAGFARKHWANESPLGKRIRLSFQGHPQAWMTIVGVAADVATGGPTQESTGPMLYVPETYGDNMPAVIVRTDGTADAIQPLRSIAKAVDPARLHPEVRSVQAMVRHSTAEPRFVTLLLLMFTGLAVVLAAVGLYGVMAYGVAQRTREIGIRMALGAPASGIGRNVVLRGATLALIGASIGLVIAGFGGRILENQLFGVSAHDPLSFAIGFGLLLLTAVLACLAPTRRAVRVDPVTAMRTE